MSTVTTNLNIVKPATGERNWGTVVNANMDLIDKQNPIRSLAVIFHDIPSVDRRVKVAAGTYVAADGTLTSYAGTSSFTCSASSTCKLYLTDAGVLTESTGAWPSTNHVRIATVVTGTTTVTSITDERVLYRSSSGNATPLAILNCVNNLKLIKGVTEAATDVTGNAREASIKIRSDLSGGQATILIQAERVQFSNGVGLPESVEGTTGSGVTVFKNSFGVLAFEPSAKIDLAPDYTVLYDTNPPGRLTVHASSASQTPAAIVGAASQTAPLCLFKGISSTSTVRDQALINAVWTVSTDGSRTGALVLYAADYSGTNREGLRITSNGSAAMVGLFGVTPVVWPAHADQAALAAQGQATLTDSSGGTATTTLNAIADTATKDAVASLAARLAEVKTDVANVRTLLARLRTDLIAVGLIKGSA